MLKLLEAEADRELVCETATLLGVTAGVTTVALVADVELTTALELVVAGHAAQPHLMDS